jgi:hypothetical protein
VQNRLHANPFTTGNSRNSGGGDPISLFNEPTACPTPSHLDNTVNSTAAHVVESEVDSECHDDSSGVDSTGTRAASLPLSPPQQHGQRVGMRRYQEGVIYDITLISSSDGSDSDA